MISPTGDAGLAAFSCSQVRLPPLALAQGGPHDKLCLRHGPTRWIREPWRISETTFADRRLPGGAGEPRGRARSS